METFQKLPVYFLNLKDILTTRDLYDEARKLLHAKKKNIQMLYKHIKIPNQNSLGIPKIGYEYGDNFEFQILNDNLPPKIEICYQKKKKILKLDSQLLSYNISKFDINHILSKLIHTSSDNIEFDENNKYYKLKTGLLYEVNFFDFDECLKRTEYYCMDKSLHYQDLKEFVATSHGLHLNQIDDLQNDEDLQDDKIYCFRTQKSMSANNSVIELTIKVDIDQGKGSLNLKLPFNKTIKDLRKKIQKIIKTNENFTPYFGIVIENEYLSDERRLYDFLDSPNTVKKVQTIHSIKDKCCEVFEIRDKNDSNKKIKNLLKLSMSIKDMIQISLKGDTFMTLSIENTKLLLNNTMKDTIREGSPQVIYYESVPIKYYYHFGKDIKYVEISPSNTIKKFLQEIDMAKHFKKQFIIVKYENQKVPFWKMLSNYQTNEKKYFEIEYLKEENPLMFKIKDDKLKPYTKSIRNIQFSSFIKLKDKEKEKENIYLCYPVDSILTFAKDKYLQSRTITFINAGGLPFKYIYDKNNKDQQCDVIEAIKLGFGLINNDFTLKYQCSNGVYDIPLNFSVFSLPNDAKINVLYEKNSHYSTISKNKQNDDDTLAQFFFYQKHKNTKLISYNQKTTIGQMKEKLQKEFSIYERPASSISFFFANNKIKQNCDDSENLMNFLSNYYIYPKALIEIRDLDKNDSKYRKVVVNISNKQHNYFFDQGSKIKDVKNRIENKYNFKITKITKKNSKNELKDDDDIPDEIKVHFKSITIKYKGIKDHDQVKIKKAESFIKKYVKKHKKDNPSLSSDYDYKIFIPDTNSYIDDDQNLSQMSEYEIFRVFTVKLEMKSKKISKEHDYIYKGSTTIGDVRKDLSPFVENLYYSLSYPSKIQKASDSDTLEHILPKDKEFTVSISKRKKIMSGKFFLQHESNSPKHDKKEKEKVDELKDRKVSSNKNEEDSKQIPDKSEEEDKKEDQQKIPDKSEEEKKEDQQKILDKSEEESKQILDKSEEEDKKEDQQKIIDKNSSKSFDSEKSSSSDSDSDSSESTTSSDNDSNNEDDNGEKQYTFKFSDDTEKKFDFSKDETIHDAKKKIVEYLNKDNANEDDNVDTSAIDIVFAGKSLKKNMKLVSIKLGANEVLNVFVRRIEDILLMTAKALRFTKEDIKKYEEEYEEEYEYEEEDNNDKNKSTSD